MYDTYMQYARLFIIKINLPKYKVATVAMAMMYKILYITYNIWLHLAIYNSYLLQ